MDTRKGEWKFWSNMDENFGWAIRYRAGWYGSNEEVGGVDIQIFETSGWLYDEHTQHMVPLFGADDLTSPDTMTPEMTGEIKWDGCSNWSFRSDAMLHLCGKMNAEDFTRAIIKAFDLADEVLPHD